MRQRFNKENVAKVLNKPGNYYFYGRAGNLLYVGWSAILKHRIQSYYQEDDFKEHPTKKELRPRIVTFSVIYRSLKEARRIERLMAPRCPFKFMKPGSIRR